MLLIDRMGRGPATWFRVAGLAVVTWTIFASDRGFSSARWWVIGITYAIATAGWIVWALRPLDSRLRPELYAMTAAGGLLLAAAPNGGAFTYAVIGAVVAGVRAPARPALVVAACTIVTLAAGAIFYPGVGTVGVLAYSLGLVAATLAAGGRRQSLLRAEQSELLLVQSQRSHEEQLRAARLEESTRVAREIHDVLAHALAGLTIQLEATAALVEQGADRETVLTRVRYAHRLAAEGLRETRMAVGALRGERVPALERIEALAADFRATGGRVEVSLDLAGSPATPDLAGLPGPVADAAVRVIQESLTNVRKHSPGAEVSVAASRAAGELRVSVTNPFPVGVATTDAPLADSGGGYGISGMQERAELLGGTLTAGPTADGWLVRLRLPLPEGERA